MGILMLLGDGGVTVVVMLEQYDGYEEKDKVS